MALIENSKGRVEGGGYERLFGNQQLGHLLSRVQATVISSGTELEKIIVEMSNRIDDVDTFMNEQKMPNGIYLISKQAIKHSKIKSDKEPDILVLKIDEVKQHCYIIELKDGDTFDTKKAAGEVSLLQTFESHLSKQIRFTTSIHICSFNQSDKDKIVTGFKKKITKEQAMTGQELCTLLGIDYRLILNSRVHQQNKNLEFFVKELLLIENVRSIILKELDNL